MRFLTSRQLRKSLNLAKELEKLNIHKVEMQTGEIWQLGDSRLLIGDSTKMKDVLKLMGNMKADMCFTDPPYILDYLHGKRKGNPTDGFWSKEKQKIYRHRLSPR